MKPVEPFDAAARPLAPIRLDGRYFTYVFPCAWEDFCKIGFSNDPLSRIRTLHPRWYEFFDLAAGALVEAETQRDARDLELELRRPLKAHRAPAPLTIQVGAGGKTEWVRGANQALVEAVRQLAERGYRVHSLHDWACAALRDRADRLYEWSTAQLPLEASDHGVPVTPGLRALRDVLDGYAALGIDVQAHLPDHVRAWYGSW
ncbi:MAG TPA: GIY-YIG nuclease family protein [Stenotrophomonas sp.]|jgi:hypothetical protein